MQDLRCARPWRPIKIWPPTTVSIPYTFILQTNPLTYNQPVVSQFAFGRFSNAFEPWTISLATLIPDSNIHIHIHSHAHHILILLVPHLYHYYNHHHHHQHHHHRFGISPLTQCPYGIAVHHDHTLRLAARGGPRSFVWMYVV